MGRHTFVRNEAVEKNNGDVSRFRRSKSAREACGAFLSIVLSITLACTMCPISSELAFGTEKYDNGNFSGGGASSVVTSQEDENAGGEAKDPSTPEEPDNETSVSASEGNHPEAGDPSQQLGDSASNPADEPSDATGAGSETSPVEEPSDRQYGDWREIAEAVDAGALNGDSFKPAGSGTESDPYTVATAEAFAWWALLHPSAHARLEADVDLTTSPYGEFLWQGDAVLAATLDGQGHSIFFASEGSGLFAEIAANGRVEWLHLGLAENQEAASLRETRVDAIGASAGALTGVNKGVIRGVVNHMDVSSSADQALVGGIVATNDGVVEDCASLGTVSAVSEGSAAGGIAAAGAGVVKSSYCAASVDGRDTYSIAPTSQLDDPSCFLSAEAVADNPAALVESDLKAAAERLNAGRTGDDAVWQRGSAAMRGFPVPVESQNLKTGRPSGTNLKSETVETDPVTPTAELVTETVPTDPVQPEKELAQEVSSWDVPDEAGYEYSVYVTDALDGSGKELTLTSTEPLATMSAEEVAEELLPKQIEVTLANDAVSADAEDTETGDAASDDAAAPEAAPGTTADDAVVETEAAETPLSGQPVESAPQRSILDTARERALPLSVSPTETLDVTWTSDDYDQTTVAASGATFTAQLPQGYELAEGAQPLAIRVTAGEAATLDEPAPRAARDSWEAIGAEVDSGALVKPDGGSYIPDALHGSWSGTAGTQSNPYLIGTEEALAWFAYKANNGSPNIHAKLINDIDLSGSTYTGMDSPGADFSGALPWRPIGNSSSEPFLGSFDGNGFGITSLYINETAVDESGTAYYGFVGSLGSGASLTNLTLKSGSVKSSVSGDSSFLGAAVGVAMEGSTIRGLVNNAKVEGSHAAGGVVGWSVVPVIECANTGEIVTGGIAGGVAALLDSQGEEHCRMERCYNTGTVRRDEGSGLIGGLVGEGGSAQSSIISDCYNKGSVSAAGSTAGGIAGYVSLSTKMNNCFNAGTVAGATVHPFTGIAGNAVYTNCLYTSSSATEPGTVSVAEPTSRTWGMAYQLNGGAGSVADMSTWRLDTENANGGLPVLTAFSGGTMQPAETWADVGAWVDFFQGSNAGNASAFLPEGDGASEGSSLKIDSPEGLAWFSYKIANEDSYRRAFADLSARIDLAGTEYGGVVNPSAATAQERYGAVLPWMPMGTADMPFEGIFDGRGMGIANLNVCTAYLSEANGGSAGLFGRVSSSGTPASLRGVVLESGVVDFTAARVEASCGALAGKVDGYNGLVVDCRNDGVEVIALSDGPPLYVGGLVGYVFGSTSIVNVVNNATVTVGGRAGTLRVAGICGMGPAAGFYACVNNGEVKIAESADEFAIAAGIVGEGNNIIAACGNTGPIATDRSNGETLAGIVSVSAEHSFIMGSFSAGQVGTGEVGSGSAFSPVIGAADSTEASRCFYNEEILSGAYDVVRGEPVSALRSSDLKGSSFAERMNNAMKKVGRFTLPNDRGIDEVYEWNYGSESINNGYPYVVAKRGDSSYQNWMDVGLSIAAAGGLLQGPVMIDSGIVSSTDNYYERQVTVPQIKTESDGTLLIQTAEQLAWFGSAIATGNTDVSTKNVKLAADIDLTGVVYGGRIDGGAATDAERYGECLPWFPMGERTEPYAQTFDGNGHRIDSLYIDGTQAQNSALFATFEGTAKNLTLASGYVGAGASSSASFAGTLGEGGVLDSVSSHVTVEGPVNVGGLVGNVGHLMASAGSAQIRNCFNYGSVSGEKNAAGIVGQAILSASIENCANFGTVTSTGPNQTGANGATAAGVFCYNAGASDVTVAIKGCYNAGQLVTPNVSDASHQFPIAVGTSQGVTLSQCAFDSTRIGVADGGEGVKAFPTDELKTWAAALYLNGGKTGADGAWTVDPTGGYPVLGSLDKLANWLEVGEAVDKGIIVAPTAGTSVKPTNVDATNGITTPYLIDSPEALAWFSYQATVEEHDGIQGKLTADIDLSGAAYGYVAPSGTSYDGCMPWVPLGSASIPYDSTFEGDHHQISNLLVRGMEVDTQDGFFGALGSSAEVRNLTLASGLVGSGSSSAAGAFAGYSNGILFGCANNGVQVGYADGTGLGPRMAAGGLVGLAAYNARFDQCSVNGVDVFGYNAGGLFGGSYTQTTVAVENCLSAASVRAENSSGGFGGDLGCGSSPSKDVHISIKGSLAASSVAGGGKTGFAVGSSQANPSTLELDNVLVWEGATLVPTGQTDGVLTVSGSFVPASVDALKSWGAAYQLNGGSGSVSSMDTWRYDVASDGYPVPCATAGADGSMASAGDWGDVGAWVHDFSQATNAATGAAMDNPAGSAAGFKPEGTGTDDTPFRIATPEALAWFAYHTNTEAYGTNSTSAQLDDAVRIDLLGADYTGRTFGDPDAALANTALPWVPIGDKRTSGTVYQKVFDGSNATGTVIDHLHVSAPEKDFQGLFGTVGTSSAAVKNVTIGSLSSVTGKAYVGGIVGQMRQGASVAACLNQAEVVAEGDNVGGIVGNTLIANVENCSNTGKVSSTKSKAGGIVGSFSSTKNTLANCFSVGTVSASANAGALAGSVPASVGTNCYYDATKAGVGQGFAGRDDAVGSAMGLSSAEFASGKAAWLLDHPGAAGEAAAAAPGDLAGVWGQQVDRDAATGELTYKEADPGSYTGDAYPGFVSGASPAVLRAGFSYAEGLGADGAPASLFLNGEDMLALPASADGKPWLYTLADGGAEITSPYAATGVAADFGVNVSKKIEYLTWVEVGAAVDSGKLSGEGFKPTGADGSDASAGTEANPYLIETAEALGWFAYKVNQGETTLHARLDADLDLSGVDYGYAVNEAESDNYRKYKSCLPWSPMGSADAPWTGTFDGAGHSINALYGPKGGLFDAVSDGTVENLSLGSGCTSGITKGDGPFANAATDATFSDCANRGVISQGANAAGGFVGRASNVEFEGCVSGAMVKGYESGGFVGEFAGGGTLAFRNCAVTGSVKSGQIGAGFVRKTSVDDPAELQRIEVSDSYISETEAYRTITVSDAIGLTVVLDNVIDVKAREVAGDQSTVEGALRVVAPDVLKTWGAAYQLNGGYNGGADGSGNIKQMKAWRTDADNVNGGYPVPIALVDYGKPGFDDITMQSASTWADVGAWVDTFDPEDADGAKFKPGGDGSVDNPVRIATPEAFALFAVWVNDGNTSASGALERDMNLSGARYVGYSSASADVPAATVLSWLPIGISESKRFSGCFDGGGHTVDFLNVDLPSNDYVGLFGFGSGSVSNLAVGSSSSVRGSDGVAGIAGSMGSISGCSNAASVTATGQRSAAAGIVGSASEISNCFNAGEVTAVRSAGGIVAYPNVPVENCYNVGKINSPASSSIVGNPGPSAEVLNCYFDPVASNVSEDVYWFAAATAKSADEFASGEVAWLLDHPEAAGDATASDGGTAGGAWGQAVAADGSGDAYPAFAGASHPKVLRGLIACNPGLADIAAGYPQAAFGNQAGGLALPALSGDDMAYYVGTDSTGAVASSPYVPEAEKDFDLYVDRARIATWADVGAAVDSGALTGEGFIPTGSGTGDSPYIVETPEALAWFAYKVNQGSLTLHARLAADVDLLGTDYVDAAADPDAAPAPDALPWKPIGYKGLYVGTFDGGGNVIDNMNVDASVLDTSGGGEFVGLFSTIGPSGTVRSVALGKGCSVTAETAEAAFAGPLAGGSAGAVVACSVAAGAKVCAYGTVGGLVGAVMDGTAGHGTIVDSYSRASVVPVAGPDVSGIAVGGLAGGIMNGCTITNAYFAGSIESVAGAAPSGAIVGSAADPNSVRNTFYSCEGADASSTGALPDAHKLDAAQMKGADVPVAAQKTLADGTVLKRVVDLLNIVPYTLDDPSSLALRTGVDQAWRLAASDEENDGCPVLGSGDAMSWLAVGGLYSQTSLEGITVIDGENGVSDFDVAATGGKALSVAVDGTLMLASPEALAWFMRGANAGETYTYNDGTADKTAMLLSANVKLAASLDLTGARWGGVATDMFNKCLLWTPIGTSDKPFLGSFDGNGKSLAALRVADGSADAVGLFGAVRDARLAGIDIASGSVLGGHAVGAVAGKVEGATSLSDCRNASMVGAESTSTEGAGGLVGLAADGSSVSFSRCGNEGAVMSLGPLAGGLLGQAAGTYMTFENCYNTGTVQATQIAGGVAGQSLVGEVRFKRSYSAGSVTGPAAAGAFLGSEGSGRAVPETCFCTTGVPVGPGAAGINVLSEDALKSWTAAYLLNGKSYAAAGSSETTVWTVSDGTANKGFPVFGTLSATRLTAVLDPDDAPNGTAVAKLMDGIVETSVSNPTVVTVSSLVSNEMGVAAPDLAASVSDVSDNFTTWGKWSAGDTIALSVGTADSLGGSLVGGAVLSNDEAVVKANVAAAAFASVDAVALDVAGAYNRADGLEYTLVLQDASGKVYAVEVAVDSRDSLTMQADVKVAAESVELAPDGSVRIAEASASSGVQNKGAAPMTGALTSVEPVAAGELVDADGDGTAETEVTDELAPAASSPTLATTRGSVTEAGNVQLGIMAKDDAAGDEADKATNIGGLWTGAALPLYFEPGASGAAGTVPLSFALPGTANPTSPTLLSYLFFMNYTGTYVSSSAQGGAFAYKVSYDLALSADDVETTAARKTTP